MYLSLVFMVLILTGTYIVISTENREKNKAKEELRQCAVYINEQVVEQYDSRYFQNSLVNLSIVSSSLKNVTGHILDNKGNTIASSTARDENSFQKYNDSAIITALNGEESFQDKGRAVDANEQVTRVMSYAYPVTDDGGQVEYVIYVQMDAESFYTSINQTIRTILISVVIAIVFTIILGFLFANTITKPISVLTKKANMMAKGHLEQKVSVKGNEDAKDLKEQEDQYSGYLSASVLRNLPQAVAIGNHDCSSASYQNHFNNPNPFLEESTPTPAGNGYFYSYGNALFIVINANNYNAADHKALIEKAIKENLNAKWRIVVMHQDIYGSGLDHSDSDGIILRTQLTPIFDANDIDVVLQGHDHSYARTYQLTSDGQAHDEFLEYKQDQGGFNHDNFDERFEKDGVFRAYYKSQNLCYNIADKSQGTVVNPEGVFYLTSNSATGSKFYNLIPEQQDYVAARSQNWRPSYSVINITKNSFTVNTYDVETGEAIDSSYTIVKK